MSLNSETSKYAFNILGHVFPECLPHGISEYQKMEDKYDC